MKTICYDTTNIYELQAKHDYILIHGHYPLYLDKDGIDIIVGLLQEKRTRLKEEGKFGFSSTDDGHYAFSLESTLMAAELLQKVFECETNERRAIHEYVKRFAPEDYLVAESEEMEKMYSDSDDDE